MILLLQQSSTSPKCHSQPYKNLHVCVCVHMPKHVHVQSEHKKEPPATFVDISSIACKFLHERLHNC